MQMVVAMRTQHSLGLTHLEMLEKEESFAHIESNRPQIKLPTNSI
jgi:hypothetical protein